MPIPGLTTEACQSRNRRHALRGGLSAAPVALGVTGIGIGETEALARINALRAGGDPLTAEQVHIRYAEAANDNYIPCRSMFLHETTLRNIAAGAGDGVSFMNSHRTGGFSSESELPFGQTFWGRFDGKAAQVGVWMLRGIHPNGANGPSTDDLAAMIDGGSLKDVSVGLYGGKALCDLCGLDLDPWGEMGCEHAPGTTHSMTSEQVAAQLARGVPEGTASYSLHNARFGEVSAVFDGAVPGAGFRKALSLAARGALTLTELNQCRSAYVTLARDHDFGSLSPETIQQLAQALETLWAGPEGEDGPAPAAGSFALHSESVLAAVKEYVARAERYDALRAQDDRPPSASRREEWAELHRRLGEVLARSEVRQDPAKLHALRVRHLQRQARQREAALAGSFPR